MLNLNSVAFSYGHQSVLDDISLNIETGQIACLLGPSGCGKSTLLRLIAGFEQPQNGEIRIAAKLVANNSHSIAPQNRQVGMLFQDLALFPHLSVTQNIAFGLHQLSQSEQQHRVDELLQLCRLQAFKSRYPHQLSGGQKQRVALARAMAPKPNLILLDEPFSSVETGLQSELVHEVKSMLQADQSTALWVTHSLDEAFAVADQMGVILGGKLLQWAKPQELYDQPAHPDVISFLNHANLISGDIKQDGSIETPLGCFVLNNQADFKTQDCAQIGVQKRQIHIHPAGTPNATIIQSVYQGGQYVLTAVLNNKDSIQLFHPSPVESGSQVHLKIEHESNFRGF
ncbi:ABC transporter ATP-binding protein [Marinicella marina]|nr:ABC transporter ATP-binding protein [Marinicella marina]